MTKLPVLVVADGEGDDDAILLVVLVSWIVGTGLDDALHKNDDNRNDRDGTRQNKK